MCSYISRSLSSFLTILHPFTITLSPLPLPLLFQAAAAQRRANQAAAQMNELRAQADELTAALREAEEVHAKDVALIQMEATAAADSEAVATQLQGSLEEVLEALKTCRQEADDRCTVLQDQLEKQKEASSAEIASLQQHIGDLEKHLSQTQEEAAALAEAAQEEMDRRDAELKAKDEAIELARQELVSAQAGFDDQLNEISEKLQQSAEAAEAALEKERVNVETAWTACTAAKTDRDRERARADAANAQILDLEAKISQMDDALELVVAEGETKMMKARTAEREYWTRHVDEVRAACAAELAKAVEDATAQVTNELQLRVAEAEAKARDALAIAEADAEARVAAVIEEASGALESVRIAKDAEKRAAALAYEVGTLSAELAARDAALASARAELEETRLALRESVAQNALLKDAITSRGVASPSPASSTVLPLSSLSSSSSSSAAAAAASAPARLAKGSPATVRMLEFGSDDDVHAVEARGPLQHRPANVDATVAAATADRGSSSSASSSSSSAAAIDDSGASVAVEESGVGVDFNVSLISHVMDQSAADKSVAQEDAEGSEGSEAAEAVELSEAVEGSEAVEAEGVGSESLQRRSSVSRHQTNENTPSDTLYSSSNTSITRRLGQEAIESLRFELEEASVALNEARTRALGLEAESQSLRDELRLAETLSMQRKAALTTTTAALTSLSAKVETIVCAMAERAQTLSSLHKRAEEVEAVYTALAEEMKRCEDAVMNVQSKEAHATAATNTAGGDADAVASHREATLVEALNVFADASSSSSSLSSSSPSANMAGTNDASSSSSYYGPQFASQMSALLMSLTELQSVVQAQPNLTHTTNQHSSTSSSSSSSSSTSSSSSSSAASASTSSTYLSSPSTLNVLARTALLEARLASSVSYTSSTTKAVLAAVQSQLHGLKTSALQISDREAERVARDRIAVLSALEEEEAALTVRLQRLEQAKNEAEVMHEALYTVLARDGSANSASAPAPTAAPATAAAYAYAATATAPAAAAAAAAVGDDAAPTSSSSSKNVRKDVSNEAEVVLATLGARLDKLYELCKDANVKVFVESKTSNGDTPNNTESTDSSSTKTSSSSSSSPSSSLCSAPLKFVPGEMIQRLVSGNESTTPSTSFASKSLTTASSSSSLPVSATASTLSSSSASSSASSASSTAAATRELKWRLGNAQSALQAERRSVSELTSRVAEVERQLISLTAKAYAQLHAVSNTVHGHGHGHAHHKTPSKAAAATPSKAHGGGGSGAGGGGGGESTRLLDSLSSAVSRVYPSISMNTLTEIVEEVLGAKVDWKVRSRKTGSNTASTAAAMVMAEKAPTATALPPAAANAGSDATGVSGDVAAGSHEPTPITHVETPAATATAGFAILGATEFLLDEASAHHDDVDDDAAIRNMQVEDVDDLVTSSAIEGPALLDDVDVIVEDNNAHDTVMASMTSNEAGHHENIATDADVAQQSNASTSGDDVAHSAATVAAAPTTTAAMMLRPSSTEVAQSTRRRSISSSGISSSSSSSSASPTAPFTSPNRQPTPYVKDKVRGRKSIGSERHHQSDVKFTLTTSSSGQLAIVPKTIATSAPQPQKHHNQHGPNAGSNTTYVTPHKAAQMTSRIPTVGSRIPLSPAASHTTVTAGTPSATPSSSATAGSHLHPPKQASNIPKTPTRSSISPSRSASPNAASSAAALSPVATGAGAGAGAGVTVRGLLSTSSSTVRQPGKDTQITASASPSTSSSSLSSSSSSIPPATNTAATACAISTAAAAAAAVNPATTTATAATAITAAVPVADALNNSVIAYPDMSDVGPDAIFDINNKSLGNSTLLDLTTTINTTTTFTMGMGIGDESGAHQLVDDVVIPEPIKTTNDTSDILQAQAQSSDFTSLRPTTNSVVAPASVDTTRLAAAGSSSSSSLSSSATRVAPLYSPVGRPPIVSPVNSFVSAYKAARGEGGGHRTQRAQRHLHQQQQHHQLLQQQQQQQQIDASDSGTAGGSRFINDLLSRIEAEMEPAAAPSTGGGSTSTDDTLHNPHLQSSSINSSSNTSSSIAQPPASSAPPSSSSTSTFGFMTTSKGVPLTLAALAAGALDLE